MNTSKRIKPVLGLGADFHHQLMERLNYIRRFYDAAASHFEEQKQLIEANLEPYVDTRNPDDWDGPAFELEWIEFDEHLKTLGNPCAGV